MVIAVITDAFWEAPQISGEGGTLDDPKFSKSIDRLKIKQFIEGQNSIRYFQLKHQIIGYKLNKAKVPCAPINKFSDALNDEQIIHRNMIVEVEHPDGGFVKMPGNPIKLSYTDEESYSPPPHLGTNTREILKNGVNFMMMKFKN